FADYDPAWRQPGLLARLVPDVAALAVAGGLPERAARLFGASAKLARITGLAPAWPERGFHDQAIDQARDTLGEADFSIAFDAGRDLPSADLALEIEVVLTAAEHARARGQGEPTSPPGGSPAPDGHSEHIDRLTPRELDGLRLLAAGQSNKEIAAALYISIPTVKRHITNLLAKLDLPSRTAATAYAHTHHLV